VEHRLIRLSTRCGVRRPPGTCMARTTIPTPVTEYGRWKAAAENGRRGDASRRQCSSVRRPPDATARPVSAGERRRGCTRPASPDPLLHRRAALPRAAAGRPRRGGGRPWPGRNDRSAGALHVAGPERARAEQRSPAGWPAGSASIQHRSLGREPGRIGTVRPGVVVLDTARARGPRDHVPIDRPRTRRL
jgi:hypothetical protein